MGIPVTGTYVIAAIRSESADADGAYGVDLDGRDSGNVYPGTVDMCTDAPDRISADTGLGGVDDQLSTVVPFLDAVIGSGAEGTFDDTLATAIERGVFAIVLDVTSVSADVCARRVHAWTARTSSGAAPAASATCAPSRTQSACDPACAWSMSAAACSGIAPAQSWIAVDDLGEVDAVVTAGRFRTQPLPRLTLRPFITPRGHAGAVAPIDLHDVVFEGRVDADGITHGDLGGAIHVADVVPWLNTYVVPDQPSDPTTLAALLLPDLAPSADGHSCADFSAGFGFTAIAATLVH